jgi:hypothetical protein
VSAVGKVRLRNVKIPPRPGGLFNTSQKACANGDVRNTYDLLRRGFFQLTCSFLKLLFIVLLFLVAGDLRFSVAFLLRGMVLLLTGNYGSWWAVRVAKFSAGDQPIISWGER